MNIQLNNYEAYFLDYHEGNLSIELVKELMEFLSQNPELREEFESFEPVTLNTIQEIKFEGKDALKKESKGINPSNFDEYAIEYIEGTLPLEKQKELSAFVIRNPHFQKELELYKKAKLSPDTAVVFDDKASLKKREGRQVKWYWSAAASIALLVGAYFMFNKNEVPDKNNLTQHTLVKDSNTVAAQILEAKDTVTRGKGIMPVSAPNKVKNNNPVVFKTQGDKKSKNTNSIPASYKDTTSVAIVKHENNTPAEPVKQPNIVPVLPKNDSAIVASTGHNVDTSSVKEPLIIVKAAQPDPNVKKKKGKFLIALATLTCKGLHKATGQHIELEKHYASDTTTVVAYQLDLGRKKFEFPVRE